MRKLECKILIEKDSELSITGLDMWVGHNLTLDILSQGYSIADAIDMVVEASYIVLSNAIYSEEDIASWSAPQESWNVYNDVLASTGVLPRSVSNITNYVADKFAVHEIILDVPETEEDRQIILGIWTDLAQGLSL